MPRSGKGEAETLPKEHDDPFAECDEEDDQQHAIDKHVELSESSEETQSRVRAFLEKRR